jgi:alpha-L-arabinofuranosidase
MPVGEVLQEMSAQVEMFDSHLQRVRDLMKQNGVSLPFHVTEFNALYGSTPELLKQSADLKSALFAARYLHLFLETGDVEAANFWCIKSAWFLIVQPGPEGLRLAPAGLVYKAMIPLMRGNVVRTEWQEQPRFPTLLGKGKAPWVTAVAVSDDTELAVSIVNWHPTRPAQIKLDVQGARRTGEARAMMLTGPHPAAMNEDSKPALITLREDAVKITSEGNCLVPPVSVTTIALHLEKKP